jgi:predicted transposase/invertase (TIGR01784 family)
MRDIINPRVDLAFKKLFGVEENKDLLISLINSIISEEDQITDIELMNPYNPRNFKNDKLSILDIKAKDRYGQRYNIEVQISDEADYDKRALYYWAKLYTEQLKQSSDYSELRKAIGIHILNFTSIPGVEKYHNAFRLTEKETGMHYFKDIELHTIELSKFEDNKSKEMGIMLSRIKSSLDRWAAFLTKYSLLDRKNLPEELNDPNIKKALEVLNVMSFDAQEREAYESHLKWLRIEASTIKKVQVESFAQGKSEGKIEGKIEIAKKMLSEGMEIDLISQFTGLSCQEIGKLK